MIVMYYRFYRGENIQELLADVPATMDLLRRSENPVAQTLLRVFEQNLRALSGQTGEPDQPGRRRLRRGGVRAGAKAIRVLHVYYHVLKQPTVFLAGDFQRSLELAEAALPLMPGMYFVTEHALYRTLARTALLAGGRGRRPRRRARDAAEGRGDVPHLGGGVPVEPRASACPRRGGDRRAGRGARPRDRSLRSGDQARARERLHPARGARPASSPRSSTYASSGPRSPAVTCKRPGTRTASGARSAKVKQLGERHADLLGSGVATGSPQRAGDGARRRRVIDQHDGLVARAGSGHRRARDPGPGGRARARQPAGTADARAWWRTQAPRRASWC